MNGLTIRLKGKIKRNNQKIPWNKWKWEHKNPKPMGHCKRSPKREIHSIIGLSWEKQQKLKQSNFTFKRTSKRTTNKDHSEWQKGNNNDWSRIKWNRI